MDRVSYGPVFDDDLVRIELRDGNWIDVKRYITAGDQAAAQTAATTRYRGGGKGKDVEASFDTGGYQLTLLQRMVKGWSFTRGGTAIAVTPTTVAQIPEHTRDLIMERINAANTSLGEDEAENLAPPTPITFGAGGDAPES